MFFAMLAVVYAVWDYLPSARQRFGCYLSYLSWQNVYQKAVFLASYSKVQEICLWHNPNTIHCIYTDIMCSITSLKDKCGPHMLLILCEVGNIIIWNCKPSANSCFWLFGMKPKYLQPDVFTFQKRNRCALIICSQIITKIYMHASDIFLKLSL